MAATLEIDAVIDPAETRGWLAAALAGRRPSMAGGRFIDPSVRWNAAAEMRRMDQRRNRRTASRPGNGEPAAPGAPPRSR